MENKAFLEARPPRPLWDFNIMIIL
jgi:hypothetical protein